MSLTAFDASTLHGFVGSPLYARNRVAPNTDAIARIVSEGSTVPFSSLYDYSFSPWAYTLNGRPNGIVTNRALGNPNAFKTVKPGWNRFTFLVWGVDVICNPWVLQSIDSRNDWNGRRVTAYNEAREISLRVTGGDLSIQESIPTHRQTSISTSSATNPNRVPLNCVKPSSAASFNSFSSVFRFQRTIKVSVLNSGQEQPYFWVSSGGAASGTWINNIFHNLNTGPEFLAPVQQWLPTNNTGLNPTNPITLNGTNLPLFSGLNASQTIGVAFVLRSVDQDSQYRALEYTDTIFQAVS